MIYRAQLRHICRATIARYRVTIVSNISYISEDKRHAGRAGRACIKEANTKIRGGDSFRTYAFNRRGSFHLNILNVLQGYLYRTRLRRRESFFANWPRVAFHHLPMVWQLLQTRISLYNAASNVAASTPVYLRLTTHWQHNKKRRTTK